MSLERLKLEKKRVGWRGFIRIEPARRSRVEMFIAPTVALGMRHTQQVRSRESGSDTWTAVGV